MDTQTNMMLVEEFSEQELEAISGGGDNDVVDVDVPNLLKKADTQVVVIGSGNKNG